MTETITLLIFQAFPEDCNLFLDLDPQNQLVKVFVIAVRTDNINPAIIDRF